MWLGMPLVTKRQQYIGLGLGYYSVMVGAVLIQIITVSTALQPCATCLLVFLLTLFLDTAQCLNLCNINNHDDCSCKLDGVQLN